MYEKSSKEYNSWQNIRQRCNNKHHPKYARYGGRGITVSKEWDSFEMFLKDVGLAPGKEYSIDRVDNNGSYCKMNCRWATPKTQSNNSSTNRLITFNDITASISEWAEWIGINKSTLNHRITVLGWDVVQALLRTVDSTHDLCRKRVKNVKG